MAARKESKSAADSLAGFMSKYTPEIVEVAERALSKLRKRFPGAIQLVYDNYNALVIAFGPSERASEIVCSIALYPRWVTLFFLHGADLPDPEGLLKGAGKTIRSVQLQSDETLDRPAVAALLDHASAVAPSMWNRKNPGALIIRSISPKKRPRRPK